MAKSASKTASFYASWMAFDADLNKLGKVAFNRGLTTQTKIHYTFGLLALCFLLFVFIDAWAPLVVMGTGMWVIWNRNNAITPTEKKVFWTALDVSVLLATLEFFAVVLHMAGLAILAVGLHLAYVWGVK